MLGWLARHTTPVALVAGPMLLFAQVGRWLGGYGWHFVTLETLRSWNAPPVALVSPWGSVPLLAPLLLIPLSLHLLAWLCRRTR